METSKQKSSMATRTFSDSRVERPGLPPLIAFSSSAPLSFPGQEESDESGCCFGGLRVLSSRYQKGLEKRSFGCGFGPDLELMLFGTRTKAEQAALAVEAENTALIGGLRLVASSWLRTLRESQRQRRFPCADLEDFRGNQAWWLGYGLQKQKKYCVTLGKALQLSWTQFLPL